MKTEYNPFKTTVYKGPEHFCDRELESQQLDAYMRLGEHVTLFAIRRLGKTGLIHHVFYPYHTSKTLHCIYMDILATGNLADLVNQMATIIYNRFPEKSTLGKKVIDLLLSFRPVIEFDELSGKPSLTLSLETQNQKTQSLTSLFEFLDQQGERIVFAIDEFQQILEYPEKNTEAILRTIMQQMSNTSFIFSGSNQQMMHEIFNSAKRPFFASCANMQLDFIPEQEYSKFIAKKFTENKRKISQQSIDFICKWTKRHTFYTQHLCSTVFSNQVEEVEIEHVREAALNILKLNEPNYYQYRNLLTSAQWNLLCAMAKEEQVFQPHSKKFVSQYKLGTPALVKRGLDALLKKELVFYNSSVEKPYYEVYDKYLMRWVQHTQR